MRVQSEDSSRVNSLCHGRLTYLLGTKLLGEITKHILICSVSYQSCIQSLFAPLLPPFCNFLPLFVIFCWIWAALLIEPLYSSCSHLNLLSIIIPEYNSRSEYPNCIWSTNTYIFLSYIFLELYIIYLKTLIHAVTILTLQCSSGATSTAQWGVS